MKAMYGTREASKMFRTKVTDVLIEAKGDPAGVVPLTFFNKDAGWHEAGS